MVVEVGVATSGEVLGTSQPPGPKVHYCVEIPPDVAAISVELDGMAADLNLYVGYPDLATVQNGGLWFWYTTDRGTGAKSVVAEPGLEDFVNPGSYYIEVSANDFEESSPFTLTVVTE